MQPSHIKDKITFEDKNEFLDLILPRARTSHPHPYYSVFFLLMKILKWLISMSRTGLALFTRAEPRNNLKKKFSQKSPKTGSYCKIQRVQRLELKEIMKRRNPPFLMKFRNFDCWNDQFLRAVHFREKSVFEKNPFWRKIRFLENFNSEKNSIFEENSFLVKNPFLQRKIHF